jgi:hypothetical protein
MEKLRHQEAKKWAVVTRLSSLNPGSLAQGMSLTMPPFCPAFLGQLVGGGKKAPRLPVGTLRPEWKTGNMAVPLVAS